MSDQNTTEAGRDPLFVSVLEASQLLGVSIWSIHRLMDAEKLDGGYSGRRRLVDYQSLLTYAANLPSKRESA